MIGFITLTKIVRKFQKYLKIGYFKDIQKHMPMGWKRALHPYRVGLHDLSLSLGYIYVEALKGPCKNYSF